VGSQFFVSYYSSVEGWEFASRLADSWPATFRLPRALLGIGIRLDSPVGPPRAHHIFT
jgi:hypothetical protein